MAGTTTSRLEPRASVLAVLAASVICAALAVGRALYTGRGTFLFLGWNLFLAWVPLTLSLALVWRQDGGRDLGPGTYLLGAAWLAFFPNAPYLVTDLVHLRARHPVPFWFDALLVAGFALTGLWLGYLSLRLVHELVQRRLGPRAGWSFVAVVAGLTGLGIYVGRFLRWNSWDLVTRPGALAEEALSWVLDPLAHLRGGVVAAVFGAAFAAAYLALFAVTGRRQSVPASVGQSP